jgi:hypothetical protein
VLDGGADGFQFLSEVSRGFVTAREFESLANPLGNRHASRSRKSLNFPVFGVLEDHLKAFSHCLSANDSWQ